MPAPGTTILGFRRFGGFSLAESLIIVAVLAVAAVVAVPAFQSATYAMRLSSITNAFVGHLQLTRSEAIKRNARVVMCKATSRAGCAAVGGWEQGWIVFHDPNNNGALDAGEPVIASYSTLPAGFRLTGNGLLVNYLSFNGMGMTKATSGAFQAGTLTLCREGDPTLQGREIVINVLGRPKIRTARLAAC